MSATGAKGINITTYNKNTKNYETSATTAAGTTGQGFNVAGTAISLGYNGYGDDTGFKENTVAGADGTIGLSFNISSEKEAQLVIANIDNFVQAIDSKRAELGAVQNRLESTIRNQSNISENVSDARSRIRDTDFATETANMTQQSIIQQA